VIRTWHCPKCCRQLEAEGAVAFDGDDVPVFQCEHCVVLRKVFEDEDAIETAYTFLVDAAGRVIDPTGAASGWR
jgi:hypothetical protein